MWPHYEPNFGAHFADIFGCNHNSCAGELPRSASSHFDNYDDDNDDYDDDYDDHDDNDDNDDKDDEDEDSY